MDVNTMKQVLSQADPAATLESDVSQVRPTIARAFASARKQQHQRRTAKQRRRSRSLFVVAGVGGLTAATAAAGFAVGVFPESVQEAFQPQNAGTWDSLAVPDAARAAQQAVGQGPEGTRLQLWTAPIPSGGECSSVITSVPGATDVASGKAFRPGSGCISEVPDGWPSLSAGQGSEWISARTGVSYLTLSGWAGDADTIEVRAAGANPRTVAVQNHRYVTWVANNHQPYSLIAFKNGKQIAIEKQDG